MRDAFGAAVYRLCTTDPRVIVLDADNSTSTRSDSVTNLKPNRLINFGIAEQNMVGMAAGLGLRGFVPVICAFASMLTARALDQIVTSLCYQGVPAVLAGHYSGVSAGPEGAVHHATMDVALMRSLPNVELIVPSFDDDVDGCLRHASASRLVSYLRLGRNVCVPTASLTWTYLDDWVRTAGPPGSEVAIVVTGALTANALRVAALLTAEHDLDVTVINPLRLKPFPIAAVEAALAHHRIYSLEDHMVTGGTGSALAEQLAPYATAPSLERIGIPDRFTESGPVSELHQANGLDVESVCRRILGKETR